MDTDNSGLEKEGNECPEPGLSEPARWEGSRLLQTKMKGNELAKTRENGVHLRHRGRS